ncbi:MAG: hypothetical protein ACD_21C00082G0003 [uncultured bacterium]|nr:MAG: hypothetical protein ACD_21C00082G0003 [uncultured bacterium]
MACFKERGLIFNDLGQKMFKPLLNFNNLFDLIKTKEVFIKLGINFLTTGVVGMFINHATNQDINTIRPAAGLIAFFGLACLALGLRRSK